MADTRIRYRPVVAEVCTHLAVVGVYIRLVVVVVVDGIHLVVVGGIHRAALGIHHPPSTTTRPTLMRWVVLLILQVGSVSTEASLQGQCPTDPLEVIQNTRKWSVLWTVNIAAAVIRVVPTSALPRTTRVPVTAMRLT